MKTMLLLAALFAAATCTALADQPKVGDVAPLFVGTNQLGEAVKLLDLTTNKNVLLYFYLKDGAPACTAEACGLRDRMAELQASNVVVIGVSLDSIASHQQFAAANQLNFALLADPDAKIANAYDVKMPAQNMAKRVTFLIRTGGKIVHVTVGGNPQTHLDDLTTALAALKKP